MAPPGLPTHERLYDFRVVNLEGVGVDTLDPADPLAAFHSETDSSHHVPAMAPRAPHPVAASKRVSLPPRPDRHRSPGGWAVFLLAAMAIAEAPFVAMWVQNRLAATGNTERMGSVATTSSPAAWATGTVYVETEPSGVAVWVNGGAAGRTPTRLSIPIGPAEIQLRHTDQVRSVPLTIVPDEVVRLRVELPMSTEESLELSESVPDTPTDIVVAVSAQADGIPEGDIRAEEALLSAEQDSPALSLAQQLPTR